MRYYIATTLTNSEAHNRLRDSLPEGWKLTYDWTAHGSVAALSEAEHRRIAADEIRGVVQADVVVVLLPGGLGSHTELGAALAAAKPVILYAPTEATDTHGLFPLFYRHPMVTIVQNWDEIVPTLEEYRAGRVVADPPVTTFNAYDEAASLTAVYPRNVHPLAPVYPVLGLVGEAGEIAEKVKKLIRDRRPDHPLTTEELTQLRKEAGDVLWYLSALARDLGSTLEEVARENVEKLKDRAARNKLHGSGDNR